MSLTLQKTISVQLTSKPPTFVKCWQNIEEIKELDDQFLRSAILRMCSSQSNGIPSTPTDKILQILRSAAQTRLKAKELRATFADIQGQVFGCCHYKRLCKLYAECCRSYVSCRLCHDDEIGWDHKLDRYTVKKIMCMVCQTEQQASAECCNPCCPVNRFASYYCDVCHLYDDSDVEIYHCEDCGICRKGERDSYTHCKRCNTCIRRDQQDCHFCRELDPQLSCPCCLDDFTAGNDDVVWTSCAHAMHASCWEKYTVFKTTCPICFKTLISMDDYFRALDIVVEMELAQAPAEFKRRRARVYCHDCTKVSTTLFHFVYLKCTSVREDRRQCGSYNTRPI